MRLHGCSVKLYVFILLLCKCRLRLLRLRYGAVSSTVGTDPWLYCGNGSVDLLWEQIPGCGRR